MNGDSTAVMTNSKETILDAAEELMARIGYEKASIAQICRESGLPVGSLYHHFGSKAGLLSAILERGDERYIAAMEAADEDALLSGEQRMRQYWLRAADTIHALLPYFTLEIDLTRFKEQDKDVARVAARVREVTLERLSAVVYPYACELGVPDPERLTQRMVTFTVVFTRGAIIEAGQDLECLRALMDDLYLFLHAALLEQAEPAASNPR